METKMVKVDDSGGNRWRRFVPNWYLVILATTVIALLVIMISLTLMVTDARKVRKADADAIECPGFPDPDVCVDKGCTYKKATLGPSCFMEKDAFGYRVENVIQESDGPFIQLKRLRSHTPYGPSLQNVTFKLTYLTENILRFQFKDANAKRYEVPIQEEFPLLKEQPFGNDTENLIYEVTHSNQTDVFHFTVKRKNGTYLWNSSIGALLLSDKYLQIGSYLPTRNIYGVGEHAHDTLRHRMEFVSWPLFAGDQPPQVPTNRKNLYGVHPFYTCLEDTGESHGVFFLNSNAMEVTFLPAPAVSFRTIGGILDFFIFVGDNSEHVVQLYTSLIGRPMIPPYWGLGFQLSRYGYRRIQELQNVMDRNRKARIPQAVQYVDIDHMDNGMDFTYNKLHFAGLPELMNSTRNDRGLKWIIIQEPFIAVDAEHYDSGVNRSIFVRRDPDWKRDMFPEEYNMRDDNVTFGKVWPPTYVAFLDFFRNETKMWWKEQLLAHRETLPFDGLWIDMNEPANFGTNEAEPNYCWFKKRCWSLKCPNGPYETPAYNPLKGTNTNLLSDKTICMQSIQGEDGAEYLHYNVHSLYGWSQTQPTVQAAQEATGTRSLVISRSTYPSSGRYAGHWLGDNYSSYKHMQRSIIGILEFNLFGIPYVGADVCGFHNVASADLCKRWMQLGAFYPYYRNHNAKEPPPQDPASYEDQQVATLSRKAIERRLRFNPYLYTLFYKAHAQGSTVLRPVFHEFPDDNKTLDMATQFMWGKSLMIAPILIKDQKTVPVYFPKDEWWFFNEVSSVQRVFLERYVIEVEADEYTPVYVRGGTILPYGNYDWNNYPESSNTRNLTLYIFPKDGQAYGELFMDDGISIDTVENEAYGYYEFKYSDCTLKTTLNEYSNFKGTFPMLERVVIFKVVDFANINVDYGAEAHEKCQCAIVNVHQQIKDMQDFSWSNSEGQCPDAA